MLFTSNMVNSYNGPSAAEDEAMSSDEAQKLISLSNYVLEERWLKEHREVSLAPKER